MNSFKQFFEAFPLPEANFPVIIYFQCHYESCRDMDYEEEGVEDNARGIQL